LLIAVRYGDFRYGGRGERRVCSLISEALKG
jgi:hypothetical protein